MKCLYTQLAVCSAVPLVTVHLSEGSLVRRVICPKSIGIGLGLGLGLRLGLGLGLGLGLASNFGICTGTFNISDK